MKCQYTVFLRFFFSLALQRESTVSQTTQPISRIPEVNFCDILPCDKVYCCPIHQPKVKSLSYEKNNAKGKRKLKFSIIYNFSRDCMESVGETARIFKGS